MFLRLVADSFRRRPRRQLLTGAALALGMAVATAAFSVSLDVGDRLGREFRSLGANLIITPQADSLPLEIDGVDYRSANSSAYLPESDLPKLKSIFWHNNVVGFSPVLDVPVQAWSPASRKFSNPGAVEATSLIGTWSKQQIRLPDGSTFETGIEKTNPWWHVDGAWFADDQAQCVVGKNLAKRNGVTPGDALNVSAGEHPRWTSLRITGVLDSGGPEDDGIIAPIAIAQALSGKAGQYRRAYVSALTKPEDDFARRDPRGMNPDELERWSCSPYVSSIAYSIRHAIPGSDVRMIRRVAEGEGRVLARVRMLLWLVTLAALLAAALAVGASSAASVIERRSEIGLMKALGAGSGTIGFLLAAEQLLLAVLAGGVGYALGILLARVVGERIFGAAPQPSFLVVVIILALAAAVTLTGSAIPLRRASRYEPAPILRGE
jgi:putative ABC transport system permease protein